MPGVTHTLVPAVPPSPAPAEPSRSLAPAFIAVFPVLGVILTLAGVPLVDTMLLLASCTGLGLFAVAVFYGGKRFSAFLSSAIRNSQ
ncbi:hypothetical protein [Streptomyces sp. NPDC048350]|uniref:hypothetical protein n=1 Tax=Streptomyces sp. NPDC048350 TaxID=3365538 RepID=UPI00371835A2